jgi:hypothetical protein
MLENRLWKRLLNKHLVLIFRIGDKKEECRYLDALGAFWAHREVSFAVGRPGSEKRQKVKHLRFGDLRTWIADLERVLRVGFSLRVTLFLRVWCRVKSGKSGKSKNDWIDRINLFLM